MIDAHRLCFARYLYVTGRLNDHPATVRTPLTNVSLEHMALLTRAAPTVLDRLFDRLLKGASPTKEE